MKVIHQVHPQDFARYTTKEIPWCADIGLHAIGQQPQRTSGQMPACPHW